MLLCNVLASLRCIRVLHERGIPIITYQLNDCINNRLPHSILISRYCGLYSHTQFHAAIPKIMSDAVDATINNVLNSSGEFVP